MELTEIQAALSRVEQEKNIRILYAAESGSRAWGFASPDSDYDVRFVYIRPMEEYLRLDEHSDVIEYPIEGELDLNGWDISKVLRQLNKSNPVVYEWFHSPIVYKKTEFWERMQLVLTECFSLRYHLAHYLGMARRQRELHLRGETVKPKKYFYVLRPILACYWLMEKKSPIPMLFDELSAAQLPQELTPVVDHLLEIKKQTLESDKFPPIAEIHGYIEKSITELERFLGKNSEKFTNHWDLLNAFFRMELKNNTWEKS